MCCLYKGKQDKIIGYVDEYSNTGLRDEDLAEFNNQWDAFASANTSKALVIFCRVIRDFIFILEKIFFLLPGDRLRFSSCKNSIQRMSRVCLSVTNCWNCFDAFFLPILFCVWKNRSINDIPLCPRRIFFYEESYFSIGWLDREEIISIEYKPLLRGNLTASWVMPFIISLLGST